MKALSISLLTAALLASITNSAVAAPGRKIMIPAPPPVMGAPVEPAPAAKPAPVVKAGAPEFIALTPQVAHVSHWAKVQQYTDDVTLKPGQDKMQLRMVINNGVEGGAPGFSWFRVKMNGDVLFTQDALKGKKEGAVDVTGLIPAGTNQVQVEAAGVNGATITWQIATPPVKILSVTPKNANPGDTVIVKGQNFPSDVQMANVMVGENVGDVLATSPTTMKVKLPDMIKGTPNISIEVNGLPPVSYALGVSGSAAPFVAGVDQWCAPAGGQVKIRGKFFSKVPAQNQVFFGNVAGQVVSGDAESITVVVPAIPGGAQANVALSVMANGKRSSNSIAFQVGRNATDPGYAGQVRQEVKVGTATQMTQNSSQAALQSSSSASFNARTSANVNGWGSPTAETQSSSQSGGFSIVAPWDK